MSHGQPNIPALKANRRRNAGANLAHHFLDAGGSLCDERGHLVRRLPLRAHRNLPREEGYFTFSYSPFGTISEPSMGSSASAARRRAAYSRTEHRLRALQAGYQMHIPKPIEYAQLITVMASLVNRRNESD